VSEALPREHASHQLLAKLAKRAGFRTSRYRRLRADTERMGPGLFAALR
jgi:hypothetical protein